MKETCGNCKHWEWNIIGVDKDRRPGAGRCFYYIDECPNSYCYYKYGYEKGSDCKGYQEANGGDDEKNI